MSSSHRFNLPLALYVGVLAFVFATAAQAQAPARIGAASPNPAPTVAARAAMAAPQAGGLRSVFPAGLSAGSGTAASTDPVAASNAPPVPVGPADPNFNTTLDNAIVDSRSMIDTSRMGAAQANVWTRTPAPAANRAPAPLSAVEIARAFLGADLNADGELTRAEAGRISIALLSFEEMDRNFDGVLTRGEYEDAMR